MLNSLASFILIIKSRVATEMWKEGRMKKRTGETRGKINKTDEREKIKTKQRRK